MPNKLPNKRNTYNYPDNTKENYNKLIIALKILGLDAATPYIQNHTPPRPKSSKASITKKPRQAVGTWKGKAKNGIETSEVFLKSDGTPFTVINQTGLNLQKKLKKSPRKKKKTTPQVRKLPSALLERFNGAAPKNYSRSSRNKPRNGVVLTVR